MEKASFTLPKFMEKYLGEIKNISGFVLKEPFDELLILSFNSPVEGVRTYSTLGLSKIDLYYEKEGERFPLKEEIMFGTKHTEGDDESIYQRMLTAVVEFSFQKNRRILKRGDIININDDIVIGTKMSAFYVCNPVAYTDNDALVYKESKPYTVFLWLIPIYESERLFIEKNCWNCFEELLEKKDPDLFDLQREALCPV